jgi:hypothetical protein
MTSGIRAVLTKGASLAKPDAPKDIYCKNYFFLVPISRGSLKKLLSYTLLFPMIDGSQ